MKSSISIMMAIAVCASSSSMLVNAQNPKPTAGHSATLLDGTVFIQGGLGADGRPSNAAYSLRLGQNGAYKGSTLLDITQLAGFSTRGFHSSVQSLEGLMINCGGFDAAGATAHKMSCDIFNPIKYTSTKMDMTVPAVSSRGGMAVAIGGETTAMAYYIGGSLTSETGDAGGFSNEMNMLTLASGLKWRSGTPMPIATRYHTATWVESIKTMVILGGQVAAGTAVAMNVASTFTGNSWSTRPITGDAVSARFGHSAVEDENGNIYIYGGQTAIGAVPLNDIYLLNTAGTTWTWKKINVPTAEPRAFHASVLLNDSSILHIFGQAGAGPESAVDTFSLFDTLANTWTAATARSDAVVAKESPIKDTGISNNPNNPNFQHPGNDPSGGEEGKSGKGGVIGGAVGGIAAVLLLVAGFIFYRKRQAHRHNNGSVASGPYSKHSASASGQIGSAGRSSLHLEEGGDKSKLGRSFTIRQPAPAYIDDNSVQDLKHVRPYDDNNGYNNKYNDRSAGGYDGEPAVIEYELTDTSGHRYEPGSVAERKRYVEEQQRQLMSGFESVYPDQPLPFHHQQYQTSNNNNSQRSNNNNNQPQQDDFYGSPTLTAASSPRGEAAKLGGRSPSQSRRNRSQSRSEQGANAAGGYTAQSPSTRAQQAQRPYDQYPDHSEYFNNKF
ncbi:hypothetical protein BG015_007356 [Linnemannia schmuckeri]|uniref:Galactose oxidase n=1 Tax=Linnemannia schmuckeri TaxID=64567 RepID=A0A9P5RYZ5_9FUNG|nr:hypothetical protein BG015_007356 [Linnemannia schmuckeri]